MWKNNFKLAFRICRRNKVSTGLNIAGLAVGMAAFIIISLWVRDELSYERYHENSGRLCRVIWNLDGFKISATPGPFPEWLDEHIPEIEIATKINHGSDKLVFENQKFRAATRFVEPELFDMLTFQFIHGDPKTALTDISSIVITESVSKRLFGDENPLGKTLFSITNGRHPKQVTGVVKDMPRLTHSYLRRSECFMPLQLMKFWRNPDSWEDAQDYKTYVLLKQGASPEQVTDRINQEYQAFLEKYSPDIAKRINMSFTLQPFHDIRLHSDFKFEDAHGNMQYVIFLSMIAVFSLIIAWINYINLTTAHAVKRSREIGLRKTVGAARSELVRQFLTEALIISAAAMILAVILVELSLPAFNQITGKPLGLDYSNPFMATGMIGLVLLTALSSGLYPAFFLTTLKPVVSLKQQTLNSGKAHSSFLRKCLVVGQFAISIIIISVTLIVGRQLDFMRNKNLGFDKENLIFLQTEGFGNQYPTIKSELLQNPRILNVSCSSDNPLNIGTNGGADWEGKAEDTGYISFPTLYVSDDFAETYGLQMAKGRFYSDELQTDREDAFVVNEAAVRAMGLQNPVGKRFSAFRKSGRIIGVVEDFHFRSLKTEVGPLILFLNGGNSFLHVRLRSENIHQTLNEIKKIYLSHFPDQEIELHFLDEQTDALYQSERRLASVFLAFSVLAIVISCLGLFGLVLYVAENKTKEIGIRKVLGSSVSGIILLLTKDFIKWIVLSNLIAWPIAFWAMRSWLQNFAYRIELTLWPCVLAGAAALIIALFTVSWQAVKAATANPVEALKYE